MALFFYLLKIRTVTILCLMLRAVSSRRLPYFVVLLRMRIGVICLCTGSVGSSGFRFFRSSIC